MARAKHKSPPATRAAPPQPERAPQARPDWFPWILPALLAIAAVALSLQRIDLTMIDLGRHLKNGEIILTGSAAQRWGVLHTNYYSYTNAAVPFINHHWLSGVVFYLVWKLGAFPGLSLFYAALTALTVLIAYTTAARSSHWTIAAPLMMLALPNIVLRAAQVRPEGFTNLLVVVYYAVLLAWFQRKLATRWIFAILPALTLLWVNLHIGFIFGFVILGMFGLKVLAARDRVREFGALAGVCVAAGLVNPSGLRGLLLPLNILNNYAYTVPENQSLAEVSKLGYWLWEYNLFVLLAAACGVAALWRWLSRERQRMVLWPELLLLISLAILSAVMVRNIPIFCVLVAPVLAAVLAGGTRAGSVPGWPKYVALGIFGAGLIAAGAMYVQRRPTAGIGLRPGVEGLAAFLRSNAIQGPLWNSSPMGGYLIFHRFDPAQPARSGVFVDMRPEVYSNEFVVGTYLQMQVDQDKWRQVDGERHFNALVYAMEDYGTPLEQSIRARVDDPDWAPVYSDFYSLVFVRRTPENAALIAQHEIPRQAFR